ncbi:MAG: PTS system mannose/fructose/sorbose family transporter subunit IID [Clostridium sp.]|nr:PTS system mannose/fructose/sorbose family transporter subunit IID [Clostridium sp.]
MDIVERKEKNNQMQETDVITRADMMKVFWRSFFHEASFNLERYQALGIAYTLTPILKKLYKDKPEELSAACMRHVELYNAPVQISNFTIGLVIALEEKNARTDQDMGPLISSLKTSIMGPLSAIGDTLFWGVFRIVAASIGASMMIKGNPMGAVLFVLMFNLPHIALRYFTLFWSYKLGDNFLGSLSGGVVRKITESAYLIGQMVVGAMTAAFVAINMPLNIQLGETALNLQTDVLDAIFPNLLSLLVTVGCAWLMRKKNVKTVALIIILLAVGVAGGAMGILG